MTNRYYIIQNKYKYDGSSTRLRYLSNWERKYMFNCDHNKNILLWSYERVCVPYYDSIKKRMRKYKIDFKLRYRLSFGKEVTLLVEVKPYYQIFPPDFKLKISNPNQYFKQMCVYEINRAKWISAKKYSIINNYHFYVTHYNERFGKFIYLVPEEIGIEV